MRSITNIFTIAVLFLALSAAALAQQPVAAVQAVAPDASTVRLEAFDKVWSTVNEKHYDPSFGGVDWKAVREAYLPKATAAKTDEELNVVLRRMLGELKLSHFGIIQRDVSSQAAGRAGIGVEVKVIGGEPVISRIDAGSTAEAAGLKPGFVVRKISGNPVADLLKPLETSLAERSISDRLKMVYRERTVEALMTGPADSKVTLEALNAADQPQIFEVARKPFAGEMSQPLGNFPAQPVVFESKLLPGNIGYIRFNMWVIPQMAKIRAAVREFGMTRGIIFDLRGNPGGVGGMAPGVAGLLMDKQISLGSMRARQGTMNFIVYPQEAPFLGPVVILTDHGTGSTSEVFAAGLQETGRAVTIGETTAGAVLPSVFEKLPTGAIFQYAVADYRSPKDILIEGRGVPANLAVPLTRESLLAGHDTQLETAIKYVVTASH
jgi:carboxyl-terminal processing protease